MVSLALLIEKYNAHLAAGERPLTQARLAQSMYTSESLVSRHISGAVAMKYETALRYAQFFGVRVAEVDSRFSDAS